MAELFTKQLDNQKARGRITIPGGDLCRNERADLLLGRGCEQINTSCRPSIRDFKQRISLLVVQTQEELCRKLSYKRKSS